MIKNAFQIKERDIVLVKLSKVYDNGRKKRPVIVIKIKNDKLYVRALGTSIPLGKNYKMFKPSSDWFEGSYQFPSELILVSEIAETTCKEVFEVIGRITNKGCKELNI